MRIVYISDSAIPSSSPNSVHVMKMCQALAELGHTVTLEAKNTTACLKDVRDIHAFYAVRNSFKVNIFPRIAFKGSGAFCNASLTWRLPWISADLIYTRSITAAFLLLLYGKAVVFEVHEPYEGKAPRIRNMFRYIINHSRLVKLVVISQALKEYYLSNFRRSEDLILVSHDGADPFPSAEPILKGGEFKIGYVGSLYSGKGMEILIPLAAACPEVKFHVVGGNKGQIDENKLKAKGINNLVFHGFKSQQELPSYIASFDAVIAPYTSTVIVSEKAGANNLALWMSPLKIFEYMSAGKPIVTSDLPVIREILTDGDTALLCNPSSLEAWERAVTALSKDTALRHKLSKNSLILFTEKYTWKKRAEQILEAIVKA